MTDTESEHGVVRAVMCYSIDCADCGPDCWDEHDFIPTFASEVKLREALETNYGWTHDRHGRWLCIQCTRDADCARDGHQWPEWQPSCTDSGVLLRWCEHCAESEESLAALHPRETS